MNPCAALLKHNRNYRLLWFGQDEHVSPYTLIRAIGVLFVLPTLGWLAIERRRR